MSDENGRERGILTPADREYLRGEKTLSEGSEYNRKREIRRRFENAILDFPILFDHWDDDERAKAFDSDSRETGEEFNTGLRDALALILYSVGITDHGIMGSADRMRGLFVDELIEDAVVKAGRKDNFLVEDVEPLQIDATRLRIALRDLEKGEDVPPTALGKVIEAEKLSKDTIDEIQGLVREDIIGGASGEE